MRWLRRVRREPGQGEGDGVSLGDDELGALGTVLVAGRDRGGESQGVRSADADYLARTALDPRRRAPVVEARGQLDPHRHPAAATDDEADQLGEGAARGHRVDHHDDALIGLVGGLEDQGPVSIPTFDSPGASPDGQQETPVLRPAEQRREASGRVEARHAHPVHRPLAAHQGGGARVAQQGVILDLQLTARSGHEARKLGAFAYAGTGGIAGSAPSPPRPGGARRSRRASSVRDAMPSLRKTLRKWKSIVRGLRKSCAATSRLVRP